jgi:hypothetical protein
MNRTLSGVSAATQRRAERDADVIACKNYLVSKQPLYGRDRIATPYGVAYRIANSYDVHGEQPGRSSLSSGRVQTGQGLYAGDNGTGEPRRSFIGMYQHDGEEVGLWREQ